MDGTELKKRCLNRLDSTGHLLYARMGLVKVLCLWGFASGAFGQAFQNLDFESASVSPPGPGQVPISLALPGWTGYTGGNVQTSVNYNQVYLDSVGISILDTTYSQLQLTGLCHGRYCALIQSGLGLGPPAPGPPADASLAQTGTVPADAKSIVFNAGLISSGEELVVTFNGTPIQLAALSPQATYTVFGGDVSQFAGQSGQLRFTRPVLWHSFPPNPIVYPSYGPVLLDYLRFSSEPLPAPPIIRTSPQSQTTVVGTTVDFAVTATGSPPLRNQWFFNQTNALDSATNSTLELVNVQPMHAGVYTVVVINSFGAVTSAPALLTVSARPAILTPPVSQTAVVGATVDFAVTAAGSPPLLYQWFFDKTNALDGATHSTLELVSVQPAQDGAYTVVVTNIFGAVTSAPAPLMVIASPVAGTVVAWGDNSEGESMVPVGLRNVLAISAGGYHNLALKSDGTLVAWGANGSGQTSVPAGLSNVLATAAGLFHSLALKSDRTVVGWGANQFGQTTVPPGLSDVVAIAAGEAHSLALKADGTVIAWGYNGDGESTVPASLQHVVAIAAGGSHSLALKSDGTVVAWGGNQRGQTNVPAGLRGVIAVAGGGVHSLALKSDGTVVSWGDNQFGQTNVPAGLRKAIAITAGFFHSLVLQSDGTLVTWGANDNGQSTVPAGLSNLTAIAAARYHNLALVGMPGVWVFPASQTAEIGSFVTFAAQPGGDQSMTYQWFFNGTNVITGSTTNSCLQLTEVQPSQTGAYTVVVTNAFGAVTSAPAMLSVIPPVPRRMVPALSLFGQPGSVLNLEDTGSLSTSPNWAPFDSVMLTNPPQWYFDLTAHLPPQRFYRTWQTDIQSPPSALDLHIIPALTLTGAISSSVRVDCINQVGPTDAWMTLDTVTLTNSLQLYFDTSSIGQPPRLWRIVPVP